LIPEEERSTRVNKKRRRVHRQYDTKGRRRRKEWGRLQEPFSGERWGRTGKKKEKMS